MERDIGIHSESPYCCSLDGYTLQVHTAVGGKGLYLTSTQMPCGKGYILSPHVHAAGSRDRKALLVHTAEVVDRCTLHLSEC